MAGKPPTRVNLAHLNVRWVPRKGSCHCMWPISCKAWSHGYSLAFGLINYG